MKSRELLDAQNASLSAHCAMEEAKRAYREAQERLDLIEEKEWLERLAPVESLTAEALGERVADHARDHTRGETDAAWRLMRRALRHLVARAEGRERSIPAADIVQEVALKYEGTALRSAESESAADAAWWRAKAQCAREIEKRLRGEP